MATAQEEDEGFATQPDTEAPSNSAFGNSEAWRGFVETLVPPINAAVSGATSVGRELDKYFGTENMTAFPKINQSSKAMGETASSEEDR